MSGTACLVLASKIEKQNFHLALRPSVRFPHSRFMSSFRVPSCVLNSACISTGMKTNHHQGNPTTNPRHYHGKPCKKCGGTLRRTHKNNSCVACCRAREVKAYEENRQKPGYLEENRQRVLAYYHSTNRKAVQSEYYRLKRLEARKDKPPATRDRILDTLKEQPATIPMLAEHLNVTRQAVYCSLARMIKQGLVNRVSHDWYSLAFDQAAKSEGSSSGLFVTD